MTIDQQIYTILAIASFAFGASIASFLNVVIWRVPRGESIVSPPSHCPKCNAPIRWYQNIPILSWLALRGKCANCHAPISARYILIETLGGLLFLATFWQWGLTFLTPVMWIWISLMIVGSMIDFDHKLLPDFVTIGGMVLGIVLQTATSLILHSSVYILHSLAGLVLGFGLMWLIRYLGTKAFKREAMGMGDVLLMGAVGALFGPIAVLFTLMVSALLGSVVGFALIALSKARLGKFVEIPYGPYICVACLVWMFYGFALVACYLHLIGLY